MSHTTPTLQNKLAGTWLCQALLFPQTMFFSISGFMVSKLQCSLAHSNGDALVFLCKNSFLKQAVTCTVVPAQTDGVPSAVASATDVEEELEPPLPQLTADQVSDSDDEEIVLSD